jgi:hypothetical protein
MFLVFPFYKKDSIFGFLLLSLDKAYCSCSHSVSWEREREREREREKGTERVCVCVARKDQLNGHFFEAAV